MKQSGMKQFSDDDWDVPYTKPVAKPKPTAPTSGTSLADQLRAQYSGNWNISGIDRAQELAGCYKLRV